MGHWHRVDTTSTRSIRSYDQYEPAARALDVVGQRWTLLLVREMLSGQKRFTDLRLGLPGIGPNVLAERLAHLQESGLVRRARLPPPAASTVYELTELGEELRPLVGELTRWGRHFLGDPTSTDRFRLSWLIRELEGMFRSEAAIGVHESYEFRLDGAVFHARVDDGQVRIAQGPARDPAWIVTTDLLTFIGMGAKLVDGAEAFASGRAHFWGDPEAGARSVELLGPHLGALGGPGGMLGAIQARVRTEAAVGVSESYEFRVGGPAFHIDVKDGEVDVRAGPAEDPAFVYASDLAIGVAMYLGQMTVEETLAEGGARLDGDLEAAARAWRILDFRTEPAAS